MQPFSLQFSFTLVISLHFISTSLIFSFLTFLFKIFPLTDRTNWYLPTWLQYNHKTSSKHRHWEPNHQLFAYS